MGELPERELKDSICDQAREDERKHFSRASACLCLPRNGVRDVMPPHSAAQLLLENLGPYRSPLIFLAGLW